MLAQWQWPGVPDVPGASGVSAVSAVLMAVPGGQRGAAAQRHWQAALGLAPCLPVLRKGVRVGWRSAQGTALRVAYGHWPQDVPALAPVPCSVVLVAWRSATAGASGVQWAVDCTPDLWLPDGPALLRLYGAKASADFPLAWAELEASAKLVGGLREDCSPARPQRLQSRRVGPWAVALAENGGEGRLAMSAGCA